MFSLVPMLLHRSLVVFSDNIFQDYGSALAKVGFGQVTFFKSKCSLCRFKDNGNSFLRVTDDFLTKFFLTCDTIMLPF